MKLAALAAAVAGIVLLYSTCSATAEVKKQANNKPNRFTEKNSRAPRDPDREKEGLQG